MLSRPALRPKRGGGDQEGSSSRSGSHHLPGKDDYAGPALGSDQAAAPLTFCCSDARRPGRSLLLKELIMSSVQLIGESELGISEKAVLWDGHVFCTKRLRRVSAGKLEYGRRVERLAQVGGRCHYLVPLLAYVYTKRIKVVVSEYYAMGSLADLLAGARNVGHTPLKWRIRARMILQVAEAIFFIHKQPSSPEGALEMNVHGNVKSSNVLVTTDFSARLSDYGFIQLAKRVEPITSPFRKLKDLTSFDPCLSQEADIYNFGVMVLDLLGGPTSLLHINCIAERRREIKEGKVDFFEFRVEDKYKRVVFKVLDIALASTDRSPEARPSIDHILGELRALNIR